MTYLHELQSAFQAYLLRQPSNALGYVREQGRLGARERLDVYATAYRLRLLEALETDFVALRAYLGEDDFAALGDAYITAHPSGHFSLRYFGRHMAAFLAADPAYAGKPLLAELAAFDWALTTAFDAPDDPVLTAGDLAAVDAADWPNLRFRPHASVQRLDLRWNAPAIWKAADTGAARPVPAQAPAPIPWAVWRQHLNTYFRSLEADEAYALDALRRGLSFGAMCEGLCEWIAPEHVPGRAAGFLRQWIEDGMLREFSVQAQVE